MRIKKITSLFLVVALLVSSLTINAFANSKVYESSNLITNIIGTAGGTIKDSIVDKKAKKYEMNILWDNGIEAQIVQDLNVSDGSERYTITEDGLINELIFLESGELLLDGQPVMITDEYGNCETLNVHPKITPTDSIARNAVWFQTLTPLVGSYSDYSILKKDHGKKSIAFTNALSALTLTTFVTIVTAIVAYPATVGLTALQANIVGTGTSVVTGGTLAVLDSVLSLTKMQTPNEKAVDYKVLEYSYNNNSLRTMACEYMTLFYPKNSNESCGMTLKYTTMSI